MLLGAILMFAAVFALFAGRNRRLEFDGAGQLVTKRRP
jgi:CP family cyanate transporter-like MFS transporter